MGTLTDPLPQPFSRQDENGTFLFADPLMEARVIQRPNRFIVDIELSDGTKTEAHCPATGGIGGWEISGLDCLISGPYGGNRRTEYTLEALKVPLMSGGITLVGVNQSAANRYVEASLLSGQFSSAVGQIKELKREKKLGSARIDFNVDGEEFIEVKTPLQFISLETTIQPKTSGYGSSGNPSSVGRLLRHVRELTGALEAGQKAILLTCFVYDAPTFNPPRLSVYNETFEAISLARSKGLESWQVNYEITREGVRLLSLQELTLGI